MKLFPLIALVLAAAVLTAAPLQSAATSRAAGSRPVVVALAKFQAAGLPTGPAVGIAQRRTFAAGFSSPKHMHSGPTYIYVVSGTLEIIDDQGTRTYSAGSFVWKPAMRVLTIASPTGATIFLLAFMKPGAQFEIPVK
jgi:quercetin dioxygenase-like cupin family protein